MNQRIVAITLLYVTKAGEPGVARRARRGRAGFGPGPGVQLTVTLLYELLGDRHRLPFLGDDDPRRDVSEDAEEADERGRREDQPHHGHLEAGVFGQARADPGDHPPVEGTDQPLAVAVTDAHVRHHARFPAAGGPPGPAGAAAPAYAGREPIRRDPPPMPRSTSPAGTDLLRIDDQLTEDERLVRDTARAFATDRVLPHVADWFEAGTLPKEIAPEVGKLGLLGMHLTGYGWAGLGGVAYGVACREMEAADSGLRSLVSVQGSLCMFPIWRYGSEEQKQEGLPRVAGGAGRGWVGLG